MTRAYAVGPVESHARGPSETLLTNPRFGTPLWVTSIVALLGLVDCARQAPPVVGGAAYVCWRRSSSSESSQSSRRPPALTVFWYNERPRVAALVPVVGVPVLTAGLLWLVTALQAELARRPVAGPVPRSWWSCCSWSGRWATTSRPRWPGCGPTTTRPIRRSRCCR